MFGSITGDSPLLTMIVAAFGAIVVGLLVSVLVSGWRERRNAATIRREPVLDRGPRAALEPEGPYLPATHEQWPAGSQRRFGYAALAVSFLGGLVAGASGLTNSSTGELGSVFHFVAGLIDP